MKHHNRRGVLPAPRSGFVDRLSREFTSCMALDGLCHGERHRPGKLLGDTCYHRGYRGRRHRHRNRCGSGGTSPDGYDGRCVGQGGERCGHRSHPDRSASHIKVTVCRPICQRRPTGRGTNGLPNHPSRVLVSSGRPREIIIVLPSLNTDIVRRQDLEQQTNAKPL